MKWLSDYTTFVIVNAIKNALHLLINFGSFFFFFPSNIPSKTILWLMFCVPLRSDTIAIYVVNSASIERLLSK